MSNINAIWQEKNLVRQDDSTSEVIRKHRLFKGISDKISQGVYQRGRDFGGTEEDSIYNDENECCEILYHRAVMKHDREATVYILDNEISGLWWMQQQLSIARAVLDMLESFVPNEAAMALEPIIQKLKTIVPDPYPVSDDSEDESEDDE